MKKEFNLSEKIKELEGERNLARREKSWGIARDLTKEIKKLKEKLKDLKEAGKWKYK